MASIFSLSSGIDRCLDRNHVVCMTYIISCIRVNMSCARDNFVQKSAFPKYAKVVNSFFQRKIIPKFVPHTFYKRLLIKANSSRYAHK